MQSVKELLLKSNKEKLLDEYMKMMPYNINVDIEKIALSNWLNSILILQEKRDVNSIVIVNKVIDYFFDEEKYEYMDASVIHRDELENSDIKVLDTKEDDVWNMTQEESNFLLSLLSNPQSYAFEFCDWDEILGYSISQYDIDMYGLETILASVIYEMTFFGYEKEEMEEKKEDLNQTFEKVKEILKQPNEEQENYFVSSKEVFKELNFEDTRTKEEEERDYLYLMHSMIINRLRNAKLLLGIKNELMEEKKNG